MICPLTTVVLAVSHPHEHWLMVSSDMGVKKVAVIIEVVSKFDILNVNFSKRSVLGHRRVLELMPS